MKESQKTIYEVWKANFIKLNSITEDFFKNHIFLTEIQEIVKTATNAEITYINYYYKLDEVYLYSRGNDWVTVNPNTLNQFNESSAKNLLKESNTVRITTPEPHPTLGETPNLAFPQYSWGSIGVNNIKDQPQSVLSCQDALAMLQSCRNDILPKELYWKPKLGLAWITGFGGDVNSSKEDCASATVNFFQKKVDTCDLNIKCSQDIGL